MITSPAPRSGTTGDLAPWPRRPVLVGGCPRSGTTLLGAMLGVGAQVVTVPEAAFKWSLLQAAAIGDDRVDRAALVRHLARDRGFGRWGLHVSALPADGVVSYARALDAVVGAYAESVGKPESSVWVDHTPSNLKYAATLSRLLPRATFVHVVRDGRAVAASVRPLDWGPNGVDSAATWWAAHVAMGLAAESALGDRRVVRVHFEDLVESPAASLERLRSLLDLPDSVGDIASRDFVVDEYTRGQHRLVAAPPDASRVEAWRGVLRPRDVEVFERRTGDLLELLGYGPDHGPRARPVGHVSHLAEVVGGHVRGGVVDRVRRWRRRHRPTVRPDRRAAS